MEARVSDLEKDLNEKTEKLLSLQSTTDSISAMPKSDAIVLRPDLEAVKALARAGSIAANDCEQYSRRQNIRIRGINIPKEMNTAEFVAEWINTKLEMPNVSSSDIAAAHPIPVGKSSARSSPSPSTILVRFHRRDLRDSIIAARKILKKTGVTISDDLTSLNSELLSRLQNDHRLLGAWSWKGKIKAKLSETKTVIVKPYQSVDELLVETDDS